MDLSALFNVVQQITKQPEEPQPVDPNIQPIAPPQILNLSAMQDQQKREVELSHRAKQKKNKKIERSKGYYDRVDVKDKKQKKANKLKFKKSKKQNEQ